MPDRNTDCPQAQFCWQVSFFSRSQRLRSVKVVQRRSSFWCGELPWALSRYSRVSSSKKRISTISPISGTLVFFSQKCPFSSPKSLNLSTGIGLTMVPGRYFSKCVDLVIIAMKQYKGNFGWSVRAMTFAMNLLGVPPRTWGFCGGMSIGCRVTPFDISSLDRDCTALRRPPACFKWAHSTSSSNIGKSRRRCCKGSGTLPFSRSPAKSWQVWWSAATAFRFFAMWNCCNSAVGRLLCGCYWAVSILPLLLSDRLGVEVHVWVTVGMLNLMRVQCSCVQTCLPYLDFSAPLHS